MKRPQRTIRIRQHFGYRTTAWDEPVDGESYDIYTYSVCAERWYLHSSGVRAYAVNYVIGSILGFHQ